MYFYQAAKINKICEENYILKNLKFIGEISVVSD